MGGTADGGNDLAVEGEQFQVVARERLNPARQGNLFCHLAPAVLCASENQGVIQAAYARVISAVGIHAFFLVAGTNDRARRRPAPGD